MALAARHYALMSVTERPAANGRAVVPRASAARPVPLLFLLADTGGGHRSAALGVAQALDRAYPGRFAPVLCDPLSGPGSPRLLRSAMRLYGPVIRRAPWLWGAIYYASDSRPAMRLLRGTVLRPAGKVAARAAAAQHPAVIVSFHPLTGLAAIYGRERAASRAAAVTVVTDLAATHAAWRSAGVDVLIEPHGPPVTSQFWAGPLRPDERAALRRSLGLPAAGPVVLVTGGAEGSGGIGRRVTAILRRFDDIAVVAVTGRNQRLQHRLDRLAARSAGRLTVIGFTDAMADLLRCADLVITKAGPGTIAEAACCGTPMLLTSHLPGQERGNAKVVTGAGAGRGVPGVRRLLAELGRLHDDRGAIETMRAASACLGQPMTTFGVAELIAGLAEERAPQDGRGHGTS